ncbi:glycine zipper domain-containing protein [uncultured Thiodictyon sp.]|uniref:glycine zipper domain-containing protein n=1 Tax=uncultured Thiodictyon sp. TaxID=1846217 RepID=UPI0025E2903E|nr:glycine zipper domain-containing protein [uncultured Thiodictyon sp.]
MSRPLTIRETGPATIALIAALATAGCVTPGDIQGVASTATGWLPSGGGSSQTPAQDASDASLTPAERRLREQSHAFQKTVWEGVLVGGGAGAVAGGIYGALHGGRAEDVLKGAAIGGAAGAAVGGLAGAYVAQKQKQYASKEDQLESMTADVRKTNAETQALITSVREVIAEDKRRLATVQKQVRKGQATQTELVAARRRIADNQAVVAQASSGAKEKQTMFQGAQRQYQKDHPGTSTAAMQQQLDAYNKNIKTLDGLAKSVSVA